MKYVIGDVHGNYKSLQKLKSELNENSELIFVGDLVDRGKSSREVVKFVRENEYKCTLGNHEFMMIDYGESFIKEYPNRVPLNYIASWLSCGGKETLLSYELIKIEDDRVVINEDSRYFDDFISDINWMKNLPLYIEFEENISNKKVVVSHSCISNVWEKRDNKEFADMFEEYALWYRDEASIDSEIFNIFGHTPIEFGADIKKHYANIDTGCFIKNEDFGILSAFCIENQEVISVKRDEND